MTVSPPRGMHLGLFQLEQYRFGMLSILVDDGDMELMPEPNGDQRLDDGNEMCDTTNAGLGLW